MDTSNANTAELIDLPVKVTDGKFKGFSGRIKKASESICSIEVILPDGPIEIVEKYEFLEPTDAPRRPPTVYRTS